MHHAWLIAGREGIGKATLAYRLAQHMLARPEARDPAGLSLEIGAQTAAARQVRALSHPGLLVLRRPYDPARQALRGQHPHRRGAPAQIVSGPDRRRRTPGAS